MVTRWRSAPHSSALVVLVWVASITTILELMSARSTAQSARTARASWRLRSAVAPTNNIDEEPCNSTREDIRKELRGKVQAKDAQQDDTEAATGAVDFSSEPARESPAGPRAMEANNNKENGERVLRTKAP